MLKPLPDGGVSIQVDHFAFQTLTDGSGGVELSDFGATQGSPQTLVVITRES